MVRQLKDEELFNNVVRKSRTEISRPLDMITTQLSCKMVYIFILNQEGRLKMREWKMRYGQKSKSGKCGSGKIGSRSQGRKMQE